MFMCVCGGGVTCLLNPVNQASVQRLHSRTDRNIRKLKKMQKNENKNNRDDAQRHHTNPSQPTCSCLSTIYEQQHVWLHTGGVQSLCWIAAESMELQEPHRAFRSIWMTVRSFCSWSSQRSDSKLTRTLVRKWFSRLSLSDWGTFSCWRSFPSNYKWEMEVFSLEVVVMNIRHVSFRLRLVSGPKVFWIETFHWSPKQLQ